MRNYQWTLDEKIFTRLYYFSWKIYVKSITRKNFKENNPMETCKVFCKKNKLFLKFMSN